VRIVKDPWGSSTEGRFAALIFGRFVAFCSTDREGFQLADFSWPVWVFATIGFLHFRPQS